eukprot:m.18067 g.18067  ORF g.18067 m.18067 type:complete len:454 (-) comp3303_c0_seq1:276-1637(-)
MQAEGGGSGKIGFWELVVTAFFAVSGGPWAIEQLVNVAGPYWTIAGLLAIPWIWSLPIALMTAELSSGSAGTGGSISWAEAGLGPYFAYSVGTWLNFSVLFDNAIYPVIFLEALQECAVTYLGMGELTPFWRFVLGNVFIWSITYVNLKGITAVSQSNLLMFVTVLGPFIVMVLIAFAILPVQAYAHAADTLPTIQFGTFFTALLWNTCGYDALGPLAADVQNPARDYPRAMFMVVAMVTVVYALPVVIGAAVEPDYTAWHTGFWVIIAERIGGRLLSAAVSFSALTCSVGLYMSLLAVGARQLSCQAQLGLAPAFLGRVSPANVPVSATIFFSAAASVLIMLPFSSLVEKSALITVLVCFIQFASLVALRRKHPAAGDAGQYRIPLSDRALVVFSLLPCALVAFSLIFVEVSTLAVGVVMVAVTHVTWHALHLKDRYTSSKASLALADIDLA